MKKIIPFFILFLSFNSLIFAQEISPIQIQAIEKQAFSFIERYNKLLNFIGDTTNRNSDYLNLAKDFFVNTDKKIIYSDILPCCFGPCENTIEDFHRYIALWYQEDIKFEIKRMKLLKIQTEENQTSAEFFVKRRILVPSRNYKYDSKLVFKIKFKNSETTDNEQSTNLKISEIAKYKSRKELRKQAQWRKKYPISTNLVKD